MRPDASTLPCTPRVVARVLDACTQSKNEFDESAVWAALDPGLTAQLLDAAFSLPGLNSSPPIGLRQAFNDLGPTRIRPIATHAAVAQLFTRDVTVAGYRRLWRDSICTAHLAQLIAQCVRFANPAEAYLAGLLCNIGQFSLLREFKSDYDSLLNSAKSKAELMLLEKSCFGTTHVEIGERLARRWNTPSFLADAIRYQHYSVKSVQGATALVMICNLATRMAEGTDELSPAQLELGMALFALSADDLAQMLRDANATSEQAARELGLSSQLECAAGMPEDDLYRQIRDLLFISGGFDPSVAGDCPLIRCAMQLRVAFGFATPLFFLLEQDQQVARARVLPGQSPLVGQLTVDFKEDRSLPAHCLLKRNVVHSFEAAHRPGVLDEQIARLTGASAILCIPLISPARVVFGVAVIGIQEADGSLIATERRTLLAIGAQTANALSLQDSQQATVKSTAEASGSTSYDKSENWYRYLVENSPDIVYALDENGRFRHVSNRIETLLGYGSNELVGKDYTILLHEEDRDRAKFAFNERRCGTRATFGVELRLKCAATKREPKEPYITVELNSTGIYTEVSPGSKGGFAGTYGVARDITERKKSEEMIRHQAYHDALTGLPNRALFADRLNVAIALAKRSRQNLAVMFLDLDHFKIVNDSLGHPVGDQLLQSVARRLANCLRRGDTLARFGGDEFTLLLPQISEREAAADTARKILAVLAYPFVIDGQEHHFGASIGIALFPDDSDQVDELIKCADSAMYRVKQKGRNSFAFFELSASSELA